MSLLGKVLNRTPVPYVSGRASGNFNLATPVTSNRTHALSAMGSNGTLFAIVDATSQATASARWRLWRKARSGRREDRIEVTAHAALDLWRKPNDFFTQQELVETGQQHNDLTGETWWVITRSPRSTVPLELWPVRPDKMEPVPHPTKYLSGYMYHGPDGEEIPLALDEVIFIRRPDPCDPYRGIGPVQSILMDLDSAQYSAEWNRNFFKNSAEPGGIIKVDRSLSDDEFRELRMRWQEQHQGVAQAHRVAILEHGEWIDRKFSQRDMQFTELRAVSREIIREAFRFPVPMLGTSENVNRANADAAEVVFGRWLIVPRLDRIKQALNNDLLPLFGEDTAKTLEFDYDYETVVPEDKEAEAAQLTARTGAAQVLISTGFDPDEVMEAVGLPCLTYTKPEPAPAPVQPIETPPPAEAPGEEEEPEEEPEPDPDARARLRIIRRNARIHRPLAADELGDAEPDLGRMQANWEKSLDEVLKEYDPVKESWYASLADQVKEAAASGSLLHLLNLTVTGGDAAIRALTEAMVSLGLDAANQVSDEAKAQGVKAIPQAPRQLDMEIVSQLILGQLGQGLALSASLEAFRVSNDATSADSVADAVHEHLESLTDAQPKLRMGGALTSAQQSGRLKTLAAAPQAAYYASEQLDKNTCKYCRAVNRRWLGNSLAEAQKLYPRAGYIDCEGGIRCRGTIVAVWRPEQSEDF